jgi:YrbI family 3-deoxy-D-manno-octulosonate 8-phosphate phosphatase
METLGRRWAFANRGAVGVRGGDTKPGVNAPLMFGTYVRPMTSPERPSSVADEIRTVAIIPARGGSKGVPAKNLRTVGGVPLVVRAVRACLAADLVDAVYVSTDDAGIAAAARQAGGGVIHRPAEFAGDQATSESALLHGLDELARQGQLPQVLLFVQCTSPFIAPEDLDAAARLVLEGRADSVFSGVATYDFLWRDAHAGVVPGVGAMVGQNHDEAVRPRRQDRRPDFRETGAFYAMSTAGFRRHRHRFFGRTTVVTVSDLSTVEIDTPHDLVLAEALATVVDAPTPPTDIAAVITDFDGVHTADTAYLDETGRESVRVSRSDGLGVGRLRAAGVPMLIISKERNPVVTARARKLGVEVLQGVDDKAPAVRSWLAEHGIAPERAAYLGNDVNDLEAMQAVGWPVAVRDARPEVLAAARLTLSRGGGQGAVRELCDLVVNSLPLPGTDGPEHPGRDIDEPGRPGRDGVLVGPAGPSPGSRPGAPDAAADAPALLATQPV